jgi:peroxiredoxin
MTATTYPNTILEAGQLAPDFTLASGFKTTMTLSAERGHPVILAFYPADWSSVCGDQMVLYSQALGLFKQYNASIYGISVDSVWCHQAFKTARNIQFDLLADFEPKGEVAKQYGVYNSQLGIDERALFVIDKKGVIAWSYLSPMGVNPGADGILQALDDLKNQA